MFALALLAAAVAQPRMFLAPAGIPVQQVNPAMVAAPMQPYARASEPIMIIEESSVVVSNLPQTTTLIATQAGDFGGYTIPVIGLVVLAATIGLLAGPVED
jgi:NAD(P)-dependent dehydrogenase (short-subunit alcohol dehydrogenase family)